jgi:hypothetical protein
LALEAFVVVVIAVADVAAPAAVVTSGGGRAVVAGEARPGACRRLQLAFARLVDLSLALHRQRLKFTLILKNDKVKSEQKYFFSKAKYVNLFFEVRKGERYFFAIFLFGLGRVFIV